MGINLLQEMWRHVATEPDVKNSGFASQALACSSARRARSSCSTGVRKSSVETVGGGEDPAQRLDHPHGCVL